MLPCAGIVRVKYSQTCGIQLHVAVSDTHSLNGHQRHLDGHVKLIDFPKQIYHIPFPNIGLSLPIPGVKPHKESIWGFWKYNFLKATPKLCSNQSV